MPTYSYACKHCGHAFDIHQSFTDDTLVECPECRTASLRKVIYPVGISFKGSGFYRTDSKASAKAAAASKSSSGADSAAGSTSGNGSDASSAPSSSPTPSSTSSSTSTSTSAPASPKKSGSSTAS